ncbi:hypothetical protein HK104_006673, partial [Borealophlyctis nickersoniae]
TSTLFPSDDPTTHRFEYAYLDADGDKIRIGSQEELDVAVRLFRELRRSFVHVFVRDVDVEREGGGDGGGAEVVSVEDAKEVKEGEDGGQGGEKGKKGVVRKRKSQDKDGY